MVRSVDLARHMGFSKPSICHAVKVLKQGGFLTMDGDGNMVNILVTIYIDDGYSGTNFQRPGFQEMMKYVAGQSCITAPAIPYKDDS